MRFELLLVTCTTLACSSTSDDSNVANQHVGNTGGMGGSGASGGFSGASGSGGSALACEKTITEYCATSACVSSWPEDLTAFCPLVTNYGMHTSNCGGYRIAYDQGVDMRVGHYFDPSGPLIAIVRTSFDLVPHCLAGPAAFVEPPCGFGQLVDCSDGGVPDAGAAGAGGACIPDHGACEGSLPCCDGTACLYDGCGIDPACAQPGQPCDGAGLACCAGACVDGTCTTP